MKQLERKKQIAQEFSDLIVYCIAVQFDIDSKYKFIFLYSDNKWFNTFPNAPFWGSSKCEEAADNNGNVVIQGFQDTDCIEDIVKIGKIAHIEQFHLFPQCFSKAFFFYVLKRVYMEESVNSTKLKSLGLVWIESICRRQIEVAKMIISVLNRIENNVFKRLFVQYR